MKHINMQNFFCTSLLQNESSPVSLLQVGWDKCSPGYTYSNFRDMYIIHYVKSGYGVFEIGEQRYNIQPDSAFIVRPNTLALQSADSNNPWELYFFAFSGTIAGHFLEKTLFKNNVVSVAIGKSNIWQLIVDMAIELNDTHAPEMHCLEYLFKLLSYFETEDTTSSPTTNKYNINEKYIYTVKKYISLNFSHSIRISDIANQLNINRSHLYRLFKKETGKSIAEYLITTRLDEARRLLDDTDFSTSAIAALVGYPGGSSFFKLFKNYTGLTPQQYRIRNQAKH